MAKKQKFIQTKSLPVFLTLVDGFRAYRKNFLLLSKITLVVAIPVGLLQLVQTDAFNGDTTIVSSIAWGYAILALLYVLLSNQRTTSKLSQIYTHVSGRFLQYVIVSLLFVLFALPFFAAALIFVIFVPVYGFSPVLFLPLGLLCLLGSIYLYSRFVLALPAVTIESISSFSSIALAGRLSRKNILRIAAVLVLLFIILIGILTGITAIVSLSQTLNENKIFNTILTILESIIVVPIIMCVLATMYKKLS